MADFQTVKRRGHSQAASIKYPQQHQQLVEMGFDSASATRSLDQSSGDLEAAMAQLIGEEKSGRAEVEEKVIGAKDAKKPAVSVDGKLKGSKQATGLPGPSQAVKEIKDAHQKMMQTYKVLKCKENANHDRRMCMHYHSLSDRRRNPFEFLYSCYECPNTVDGGECSEGDSCSFSHTMLERMFHPELYKISVCQRQSSGLKCDRSFLCAFAHNDADLRISPSHLTSKYAIQEDAKTAPRPITHSAMLMNIQDKLVRLIRESSSEGILALDLPKLYSGRFHESLDVIDEGGKKYKLKDLIGAHPHISLVLNRSGQHKYIYEEVKGTYEEPVIEVTLDDVKERLTDLIKTSGAEGVWASDLPKKYAERFGDKLDMTDDAGAKFRVKDILQSLPNVSILQIKSQSKYTYSSTTATKTEATAVAAPAAATVAGVSKEEKATTATSTAAPAATSTTSAAAPKWGSNSAGKSFAAILASNNAATNNSSSTSSNVNSNSTVAPVEISSSSEPAVAVNDVAVTTTTATETSEKESTSKAVIPNVTSKVNEKANTGKVASKTNNSGSKATEKTVPVTTATPAATTTNASNAKPTTSKVAATETPTTAVVAVASAVLPVQDVDQAKTTAAILPPTSSPGFASSSLAALTSSSTPDNLPKPLFSGLEDNFSLVSGLDGGAFGGDSNVAFGNLTGILPSSFDLPLESMDVLHSSNHVHTGVLPPGLSKAIGKPSVGGPSPPLSGSAGPSLSSIIAAVQGTAGNGNHASSRETPERAHSQQGSQSERIAQLERELALKSQECEAQSLQLTSLRVQLGEAEKRASAEEIQRALRLKDEEVLRVEDEVRKLKQEKLVDLDQYFIYFSKIEDAINSMKCKEDSLSDMVTPEDIQELFQFKKLVRNYVANVKQQLKNKFDFAVQQQALPRKESIDALNLVSPVVSATPAVSSTSIFPIPLTRFTSGSAVVDPFAHVVGSNGNADPFASTASSVLFASDSGVVASSVVSSSNTSSVVASAKTCGLPGCFKDGLYTCAGCRKISYCGEMHQRFVFEAVMCF